MIAKKTKEQALQAIRSGNTAEAIQLLGASELGAGQGHTLTLIEAEYNELQSAVLKGTVSEDQRRSRSNQINDRLLTLLHDRASTKSSPNKKAHLLVGAGIVFALLPFLLVALYNNSSAPGCPDFDIAAKNRLLILPFEQVGAQIAQPHLLLRDRIETLVRKNDLSTSVGLGSESPGLSSSEAPEKALACAANAIVWGQYSAASDSIRLVLQYHFADQPEAAASELISLKDVTAIHNGKFSQRLEDAIFALCAVIALRDGELELAQKWLGRVKETETLGQELRQFLN